MSLGRGAVGLDAGAPVRACRRVALTSAPVAVAGLVLRGPIERRLGSGPSVAAAQVVAGAALWASDLWPSRRGVAKVRPADEIAIGLVQALALAPGVSRAGATLTAARLLGFDRRSSARLSRQASLPVIVGASLLEALSIAEDRPPRRLGRPFAAGATAALISTIASKPLLRAVERRWPYRALAAYRVALGAFALKRLSASDRGRAPAPGDGNRGAALAVASD
jgi:undecaprenyl-diphosphatase